MEKKKLIIGVGSIVTVIVLGVAGFLALQARQGANTPEHPLPTPMDDEDAGMPVPGEDDGESLGLRLSEGMPQPDIAAPSSFVEGASLFGTPEDVAAAPEP